MSIVALRIHPEADVRPVATRLPLSARALRDLQALHWISKYLYHTGTAWDLVGMGVFERDEIQRFADASKFIWAVRCHLHDLSGRAQEQLTFDRQVAELQIRIAVLNRYTALGIPVTVPVE